MGSYAAVRADQIGTLLDAAERHGDVVRLRMGPPAAHVELCVLRNPDHIRHVLQDRRSNYPKGFQYHGLRRVVGDGLLTSDGETWLRQRRLVQPTFHRKHVNAFAPVVTECCTALLERWRHHPAGQPLDVSAAMTELALSVIGRALFSTDLAGETRRIGDALTVALAEAYRRPFSPLAWVAPRLVDAVTPGGRRYGSAVARLDELVGEMIAARRRSPGAHGDILDLLLTAEEPGQRAMSDLRARDEVMTLLIAGHETTANALTWAWHLLATHPETRLRLLDELDPVLGDRLPGAEDVAALPVTRAVVNETLRLYPPAPVIWREVLEDDEIGGHRLPAGAVVAISPYVVHRNPALWSEPCRFDIDRFLPPSPEPQRYSYLPFGEGQRRCVGDGFAMLEAVLALATLARRVQLDTVPGHRVETYVTVTLRPRGGMPMLLSQRPPHLATAARIPAAQASLSTPVIELNQGLALE
jgi:cytochrome P450